MEVYTTPTTKCNIIYTTVMDQKVTTAYIIDLDNTILTATSFTLSNIRSTIPLSHGQLFFFWQQCLYLAGTCLLQLRRKALHVQPNSIDYMILCFVVQM
jgi:hypothetical protein